MTICCDACDGYGCLLNDDLKPCPACGAKGYVEKADAPPSEECAIVHRGWKFRAPFYCGRCGVEISPRQFAFSRSCGGCDMANSRTARLSIVDQRWFGSAELVNPEDHWLIHPEFLDPATAEQYPRLKGPQPPRIPTRKARGAATP